MYNILGGLRVKEIPENYKEGEIDLVDILIVLLKRKWIIIGLVLIAFVFSGLYVFFFSEKNYTININIYSPQEYFIAGNNLLKPTNTNIDMLFINLKKDLQMRSYKTNNYEEREYYYKYNISIKESQTGSQIIYIQLTGQKDKIVDATSYVYGLYNNFENDINDKNKKLLNITENAIDNSLSQNKDLLVKFTYFLTKNTISQLPLGSETAILDMVRRLKSDIINIDKIKELNKTAVLMPGNFIIIRGINHSQEEIIISKNDLSNLNYYIETDKSRKSQLLPVIIAVLIAFFIGIFLAYIIEFFNRDDVRNRLKDI